MKKILLLTVILLAITGCSTKPLDQNLLGHWRNDTEKFDYIFSENNLLTTVGEKGSSECTYEISKQNDKDRSIEIWFKCPQPDWPGYAELHDFEFSKNLTEVIDTLYIQGIASRIDGKFYKVGEK
ncbi:MAG: membrane lipoprotein lipid attachment site-containing protein [Patescibacteria group bacterium]